MGGSLCGSAENEDTEATIRVSPSRLRLTPELLAKLRCVQSSPASPVAKIPVSRFCFSTRNSSISLKPRPRMCREKQSDKRNSADPNVLYAGEIVKYRPGPRTNFQPRFGCLTLTHFLVFRSRASAEVFGETPIDAVALSEVEKVEEFQYNVQEENEKERIIAFFELFLKQEEPEVEFSRSSVPVRSGISVRSISAAAERGRLMRRPVRTGVPGSRLHVETWTSREWDWFAAEKRLLFSAQSRTEVRNWTTSLQDAVRKRL